MQFFFFVHFHFCLRRSSISAATIIVHAVCLHPGSYNIRPKKFQYFSRTFSQLSRTKKKTVVYFHTNSTLNLCLVRWHQNITFYQEIRVSIDKFKNVPSGKILFINTKYGSFQISRTCIRIPGLSRPGKWFLEIQGLSRISRTCTNPVYN